MSRPCRREFLQSAGCFGVSIALLGLSSADAAGLPVFFIEGTASGDDKRYPVPPADSVNIDRAAQLILVRYAGRVYVFALACPHENYAVKWVEGDHRFHCTKHDSVYEEDGRHVSGRATRNMDRYAVRREGGDVVVDIHTWVQSDKDPAAWAAASVAV